MGNIVKIHQVPINCLCTHIFEVVIFKVERFCPALKFWSTAGKHCMNLSVTEPPQCLLAKHMHCQCVCIKLYLPYHCQAYMHCQYVCIKLRLYLYV